MKDSDECGLQTCSKTQEARLPVDAWVESGPMVFNKSVYITLNSESNIHSSSVPKNMS